ncbi:hypothetical protein AB1Y20_009780 [Prymnesium parvum]|uniref:Uncharacterized protein n=1 Tax=Prymnesium parvum TaxID=97485 RepID=A0AB34K5C2_PRYPA
MRKAAEAYRSLDKGEACKLRDKAKPALAVAHEACEAEPEDLEPAQLDADHLPVLRRKRCLRPTRRCCCCCCLPALLLLAVLFSLPRFNVCLLSWMTSLIYGPFDRDFTHLPHGPSTGDRSPLRVEWRDGPLTSALARSFNATQNPADCASARFSQLTFHAAAGLGANLHGWTQDLCEVSARGHVLVTKGPWVWRDPIFCGSDLSSRGLDWFRRKLNLFDFYPGRQTALQCYFGPMTRCPISEEVDETYLYGNGRALWATIFWSPMRGATETYMKREDVWRVRGGTDSAPMCADQKLVRQAGIELLFRSLPEQMIAAAERANREVFGEGGAPERMVTVHIRWGDKGKENALVSIDRYINATHELVARHQLGGAPAVFITTEDPAALRAFRGAAPEGWQLFYYAAALGTGDSKEHFSTAVSTTAVGAADTGGALGIYSLLALLLALEARFFVLTASSNWSILINELRRARVNAGCNGCTDMISLTPAKCMHGFEYLCTTLEA